MTRNILLCALAGALLLPAAASADPPRGSIDVGDGRYLVDVSSLEESVVGTPRTTRERTTQSRIVGGSAISIQATPWQTALTLNPTLYGGNAYRRMFCGGTLVAPTVVVTAAHCLYDANSSSFTDPADYAVVSGRTTLSSSEGREIPIATYYVVTDAAGNPVYDDYTARWDLAVIQLASPASATPIKIAGADERAVWTGGRDAVISGWGSHSPGGAVSDGLHATQISMIDDVTCASIFSAPGELHLASMLCAGVLAGGRDACQGDSGGPLVVPIAGGGFRLVGNTSWGYGCAEPGNPGVYGRLADDPMRSVIQRAGLRIAGVDVVGSGAQPGSTADTPVIDPDPSPPEDGDLVACRQAKRAFDRAERRLNRAKRRLRRADKPTAKRRGRRKVARAKRSMQRAKLEVAVAC